MKRRSFIKKAGLTTAGVFATPYILPTGRLFAKVSAQKVGHVVFFLFAGGIRNQESVEQQYLINQNSSLPIGNVMPNMLEGAIPSSNLVYTPQTPIISNTLQKQGTLLKYVRYDQGPTGHFNGHTVAVTGNYTATGLNLRVNPDFPTIFEYYRKHSDPAASAINAWWLSEGLGPYPALNYSQHSLYGAQYGANFMHGGTILDANLGYKYFSNAKVYDQDELDRINQMKTFLDNNFDKKADALPGIIQSQQDREIIKAFIKKLIDDAVAMQMEFPLGYSNVSSDMLNIGTAWEVLKTFQPELTVINTFDVDICHSNFSSYVNYLHEADYGVGWLWDKIQNDPNLKDNTVMICMPEHGRNAQYNSLYDANGLAAYDHTSDDNSREVFALIAGPSGVINQDQVFDASNPNGVPECIDVVPTICDLLGIYDKIPFGLLPGRIWTEAIV